MKANHARPNSSEKNTASSDAELARAYQRVITALNPPPSQVGLQQVLRNASECVRMVFRELPEAAAAFHAVQQAISQSAQASTPYGPNTLVMLDGMKGRYPAWTFMSRLREDADDTVRLLLGAELLLATRRDGEVRPQTLDLTRPLCERTLTDEKRLDVRHRAQTYAKRLLAELRAHCTGELSQVASRELRFQHAVIACLTGRAKPSHPTRPAARRGTALPDQERRFVLTELSARCEADDGAATVLITAFRAGMPWDIAKEIPLAPFEEASSVMWIDTSVGVVYVDLTKVFAQEARVQGPQFKPASLLIRLRLPKNVAEKLHAMYAGNPAARRLGDLAPSDAEIDETLKSVSNGAIKLSLARLMRDRGASAVRAGVHPVIAAHIALELGLVGHSVYAYFNADSQELCDAEVCWFASLGLGVPVDAQDSPVSTGAAATPTDAAIAAQFEALTERVRVAKPGNHCGLKRLLLFHDAFARLVAFVVILCLGCRREQKLGLKPANVGLASILYQHKRTGPSNGLSLLPIPAILQAQIRLWLAHLDRLDGRLAGFEQNDLVRRARAAIRSVRTGRGESMIFLLSEGYQPISSADVFEGLPAEVCSTLDFGRHYLPNAARARGADHAHSEAWMRHHDGAASHFSSTSLVREAKWMSVMATAIDQICADLKVRPVVGLGEMK